MATLRQKKLAQNIIQNIKSKKGLNKQELVVSSGYSEVTADRHASEVIEQPGVQNELKKLGFDEESAKQVVKEILSNSNEDSNVRLNAAKEVFKVFGTYAAEKTFNLTATANVDDLKAIIQTDLAKFRPNK